MLTYIQLSNDHQNGYIEMPTAVMEHKMESIIVNIKDFFLKVFQQIYFKYNITFFICNMLTSILQKSLTFFISVLTANPFHQHKTK